MTITDQLHTEQVACQTAPNLCSVDDCQRRTTARGLCSMHYRRMMRTGSVDTVRTAGRPSDAMRAQILGVMGADFASTRGAARYWRATSIYSEMGAADPEFDSRSALAAALQKAIRSNGSINVSHFERLAVADLLAWADGCNDTGAVPA